MGRRDLCRRLPGRVLHPAELSGLHLLPQARAVPARLCRRRADRRRLQPQLGHAAALRSAHDGLQQLPRGRGLLQQWSPRGAVQPPEPERCQPHRVLVRIGVGLPGRAGRGCSRGISRAKRDLHRTQCGRLAGTAPLDERVVLSGRKRARSRGDPGVTVPPLRHPRRAVQTYRDAA